MKYIILSLVLTLLCVPIMASAANPFINIHEQFDQLNVDVTELEDRVTTNTTAINNVRSVNVYINGLKRGALLDANRPASGEFSVLHSGILRVMLDSRYFTAITVAGDGVRQTTLVYQYAGCTGEAYVFNSDWNELVARQGIVLSNDTPAPNTLYMIQAGTAMETIQIASATIDGNCTTESYGDFEVYKVVANDPAITGVTQGDFVGEVTLGF